MNRAKDWMKQARDDGLWAQDTLEAGRYAQACFVAQQVAEKALKALALHKGYDSVRSHSVLKICDALDLNGELRQMAKRLDQYYISSRYPDAYIEGAPFEFFTREQAVEAVGYASKILDIIEGEFHAEKG